MNEKPEAIQFADDRPSSWNVDDLYQWASDAEELIRSMQTRIIELEEDVESKPKLGDIYHVWCDMEIDRAGFDWAEFVTKAHAATMQKD